MCRCRNRKPGINGGHVKTLSHAAKVRQRHQIYHYTRCITLKSVTSSGAHFGVIANGHDLTFSPVGLVQIPINTDPNSPWPNSLPSARVSRLISFSLTGWLGMNDGIIPRPWGLVGTAPRGGTGNWGYIKTLINKNVHSLKIFTFFPQINKKIFLKAIKCHFGLF